MSLSNLGSALFTRVELGLRSLKTELPYVHGRLQVHSHVVSCVRGRSFTFYFTVKAVSILLRRRLLVGFLVVLLGTLVIVVHPLNCILLQEKTIKELILEFQYGH